MQSNGNGEISVDVLSGAALVGSNKIYKIAPKIQVALGHDNSKIEGMTE